MCGIRLQIDTLYSNLLDITNGNISGGQLLIVVTRIDTTNSRDCVNGII